MTSRPIACRAGVVTLLLVATLIVIQPLGVFWHFVDDHLVQHAMAGHDGLVLHAGDAGALDHDADHCHVWMTPADAAVLPRVDRPHMVAALTVCEHLSRPTAALFPPFPPPRA